MKPIEERRVSKGAKKRNEKNQTYRKIKQMIDNQRALLTEKGKMPEVISNRAERRKPGSQGHSVAMRKLKRAQRFTKLKEEARAIKKKFRVNFKKQPRWKEIEIEVQNILGRKGESNTAKPKKKRK